MFEQLKLQTQKFQPYLSWMETEYPILTQLLTPLFVLVLAWFIHFVTKVYLLRAVQNFLKRLDHPAAKALLDSKPLNHTAWLAPATVFYIYFSFLPGQYRLVCTNLVASLILVIFLRIIDDMIDAGISYYETFSISKEKPIKGYLQVVKLLLWSLGMICALAIALNRSPFYFLSGLGALTAVLMLVFKDTILSLVASIQISFHGLIRIGDWVEVPGMNADGDVIDINLNTVQIQNWNKTITAIPTHKFLEIPFVNWRGMTECGGRRVCRSLFIDINSVQIMEGERLDKLRKVDLLRSYLEERQSQIDEDNKNKGVDRSQSPVNGRAQTNLGIFRQYLIEYLKNHPMIRGDMTQLVRQNPPTVTGIPIQLYLFTKTVNWVEYETIQADIFDHIFSVLNEFELKIFQHPTGEDFSRISQS